MTHQTKITKDPFLGWMAETKTTIGKAESGDDLVLVFTTAKRYNKKIVTTAKVWEENKATGARSTMVFGDYSQNVMTHDAKRATEKSVAECHTTASLEFDNHLTAAKQQY